MATVIGKESPDSPEAKELIAELEAHLASRYPQESQHGFSVDKLLNESVDFFVVRIEEQAAGCGGIKIFDTAYSEIKRMYVRPQFRGLGLGKLMLDHLAEYSRKQGVGMLRLETGVYQVGAISLYESWGFKPIPPFGSYQEDPLSVFYERRIG